jgi:hypothetical protein
MAEPGVSSIISAQLDDDPERPHDDAAADSSEPAAEREEAAVAG